MCPVPLTGLITDIFVSVCPGVGVKTPAGELRSFGMKAEKKNIQWEHTYLASDKIFYIYLADTEALVHERQNVVVFPPPLLQKFEK